MSYNGAFSDNSTDIAEILRSLLQGKLNFSDIAGSSNDLGLNLGFDDPGELLPGLGQGTQGIWGKDGFGFNAGTASAIGSGIEGLGNLAQIYFGNKKLGMAEDQFNTSRLFGNRNLSNQAKTINNSLEARYRSALAAGGGYSDAAGGKESLESYLNRSKVDGSAIGG